MQSPPFPRYLVPPRSKYSTQHHVLKHPQLPFLPQCQRPSFTPIQNSRQNYISLYLQTTYHTKQINNAVGKMQTSNLEAGSLYGSHPLVSLHELHLFSVTQHSFILIAPYMYAAHFGPFSGHHKACQYKNHLKELTSAPPSQPFKVYRKFYIPPGLTFNGLMCFLWLWEQTATFALYIINRLVFITEVESVYCAVRTESLYNTDTFRLEQDKLYRGPQFPDRYYKKEKFIPDQTEPSKI